MCFREHQSRRAFPLLGENRGLSDKLRGKVLEGLMGEKISNWTREEPATAQRSQLGLEPDRTGVKPGSLSDLGQLINFPKLHFPLLPNRQLHLPDRLDVRIKPDNASKVFLEHRECLVTGTYHHEEGGRSYHHGNTPHRGWNGWR